MTHSEMLLVAAAGVFIALFFDAREDLELEREGLYAERMRATNYASALAECANGRSFIIGDTRIVHCVVTDVTGRH